MRVHLQRLPLAFLLALTTPAVISSTRDTLASAQSDLPSAAAVVKAQAYVSLVPVPRGKTFEIAIVVDIAQGFHMNSHKPTDPYLIPTTLTPQFPAGFELTDTIYPDGRKEKFSFSPNKPLDVYTGKVILRLRVSARPDAPLGAAILPITLRYQACNDTTCLQPVKLPVNARFEVATVGAKFRADHTDIFSATAPKS